VGVIVVAQCLWCYGAVISVGQCEASAIWPASGNILVANARDVGVGNEVTPADAAGNFRHLAASLDHQLRLKEFTSTIMMKSIGAGSALRASLSLQGNRLAPPG
jgi:hypothetical protein